MNPTELDAAARAAAEAGNFDTAARLYQEILADPGLDAEAAKGIAWNLGLLRINQGEIDAGVALLQHYGYTEREYGHLLGN
jgi:predicted negative regulator of RcsB-dependent stress response